MEITITVTELDVKRITLLGNKPWTKITPKEKEEYEHILALYGSQVCMKVLHRGI